MKNNLRGSSVDHGRAQHHTKNHEKYKETIEKYTNQSFPIDSCNIRTPTWREWYKLKPIKTK